MHTRHATASAATADTMKPKRRDELTVQISGKNTPRYYDWRYYTLYINCTVA